ncbi:30S ribosomal protein S1 [candidate division TA06 bacterium]|uniref:30S ribosomal protein S1 n=1 Tax=candidate division TA06 bacterium TaxID=2250710 RepID=A0A933IAR9_UNCT6|nr:30S ribosomal protein S1 [candidate division TA06 bacterium]
MAKTKQPSEKLLSQDQLLEQDEQEGSGEFRSLLDEFFHKKKFEEGEIVTGTVLRISGDSVIVDVGFKSEGVVPVVEFLDRSAVEIGKKVDLLLEQMEDQDGQIVLSKMKADFIKVWDKVQKSLDSEIIVDGKVLRKVKGGLIIDLLGVDAFLPGSQIGLRPLETIDSLLGQTIPLKIIKINKKKRNIVVSRRVVLDADRDKQRAIILGEIDKGQVREGIAKNITDFGVFVDLGGLDGLLHITDMSWGRISHPSELVQIGQKVKVKILEYDRERSRVSLGLKQLTTHPWESIETKFPVGTKLLGKIVSITDYGAFIELEKGVEGLIHISEMSWTRQVKHPSKIVSIGDEVEAMVLKIDKAEQKISLGLRQLGPDPWSSIEAKYPIGAKAVGKVRNITNFGIFVELEDSIDGLIHISDISWTKRIKHPGDVVKKGDDVNVVVTNIDKENHRISLGIKQLEEDPWNTVNQHFTLGQIVHCKVNRPLERGLLVDMDNGFEGFVPVSELDKVDETKLEETFKGGEEMDLKILEIDVNNRRIALSQKALLSSQEAEEIKPYFKEEPKEAPGAEQAQ